MIILKYKREQMRAMLIFSVLLCNTMLLSGQKYIQRIDSMLRLPAQKPFNGVILITEKGKISYSKTWGYADRENKTALKPDDQFVIGSVSKQFTAVLVLREFDKGHLDLHTPIHKYLPALTQRWADTVTIHQLLTHMHGIVRSDGPAIFKPGTQFSYSQIGYDVLAQIVEKTSGKSFVELSQALFDSCGMKHTYHPDDKAYKNLVQGYSETENGAIVPEQESFKNYPAAGTFISTAADLNIWDQQLYLGKLLQKKTLEMMETPQRGAIRDHPIFGITAYGYGITINHQDKLIQYGQTGFAPGYISMNYYFPQTQTAVIVLENIAYDPDDIKKGFYYPVKILEMMRLYLETSPKKTDKKADQSRN